jgi:hypothetical protein
MGAVGEEVLQLTSIQPLLSSPAGTASAPSSAPDHEKIVGAFDLVVAISGPTLPLAVL